MAAARRRAVEAAGGGEDEGMRGVEAGAVKTRWHGAGDGGALVSGLVGLSSKAAAVAFPALCECGRRHFLFSFIILCLCNFVLY